MKVSINDKELFTLNEIKKKVLQHELGHDVIDDLSSRIQWIVLHGYERAFQRFKKEWDPKLIIAGIDMIPTDPDKYAEMVFSQVFYKKKHG